MEYGNQLRAMREVRDLTQAEAARKAGITEKKLGFLERSDLLPTPEIKGRIAEALNWPPDELAEIAFAILEGTARTPDVIAAMLDGTASFGGEG